jgi:hypothetical protein
MDAENEAELRSLRARAYGPKADITTDRAAMRRLRELEAARRAEATGATDPSDPTVGEEEADAAPAEQLSADSSPTAIAAPTDEGTESEWWQPREEPDDDARVGATASAPRRRRVLWALSVVASAAVAAGVTYALTAVAPVSASSGVPQVATLHPTTATAVPHGFFGASEDTPVYDFYGLTIFHAEGGFGGGGTGVGDVCIMAVPTEQVPAVDSFDATSWGFDGPIYSGCSAGAFSATIEVPLRSEAPETLRARFPEARGVQFVLDGDRVGVFVDNGQTSG